MFQARSWGATYNRVLFLAYLTLLAWAPLPLGSNRPWSWSLLEVWIFSIAAAVAVAHIFTPHFYRRLKGSYLVATCILLIGLVYLVFQLVPLPMCVLQVIAPNNAQWWSALAPLDVSNWARIAASFEGAVREGLKQAAYVTFFVLTLLLVTSGKRLRLVIYLMVAVSVFEAVYGLVAHFMGADFPFWQAQQWGSGWEWASRPIGTYVNRNHFAANLSFGIALTIGLCVEALGKNVTYPFRPGLLGIVERVSAALLNPSSVRFGILVILFTALLFTRSRGGFSAISISATVFLVVGMLTQGAGSAERRFTPILVLCLVLAGVWLSGSGLVDRVMRLGTIDSDRLQMWLHASRLLQDHWLFGIGNGSYQVVFAQVISPDMVLGTYDFLHNDHLQLMLEQGLIGYVLALLAIGFCMVKMLKSYIGSREGGRYKGILLGLIIAIFAFLLHGLVDFNFHIPANALWFFTLVALGLKTARRVNGSGQVATQDGN